jgi:cell division protein FtsL
MRQVNVLAALLLMVSALALVASQQRSRLLFLELERAQSQMRELEVHWDQLQVEQTARALPALIDATARKTLKMEEVVPARSLYLPGGSRRDGQSEQARSHAAVPSVLPAVGLAPTAPAWAGAGRRNQR